MAKPRDRLKFKIAEMMRCPRDGSGMFVKRACGGWEKEWAEIAQCLKAGCGYKVGYRPKAKEAGK